MQTSSRTVAVQQVPLVPWVGRGPQSSEIKLGNDDAFDSGFSINLLSAFPATEVCITLEDSRVDE